MKAYYVPPELTELLANCSERIQLRSSRVSYQMHVDVQSFGADLEIAFWVNGNRVWTTRFSSRDANKVH